MTISQREYARRRKNLMAMMEPGSIAILPAALEHIRNNDAEYPYRQDSNFQYMTGFSEPEAVAVFLPGRKHGEYVLFCRERDPAMELWNGYRAGPEGAVETFDADDAFPIADIDEILPGLLEGRHRVYYSLGRNPEFDTHVMQWLNTLRAQLRGGSVPPGEFLDLDHILHELRLFKSAAEQKLMRKAGKISAAAHRRAMAYCKPGQNEYQLEAEIIHEFASKGARHPAYNSIVGAGENACILHYIDNNKPIADGDLVLIDAGCELQFYASDITRTFPANGVFSKEQRAIYDLVLAAQHAAFEVIAPGRHWNEFHDAAVKTLTKGLVKLGLLKGRVSTLIKEGAYRKFYMHRTGHWLGMDVHDVGDYRVDGEWRMLEPGMVLTVEPGLYISPNEKSVPAKWRGIGVRIEDDVLVTKAGHEVLTAAVPTAADDIEALMAAG